MVINAIWVIRDVAPPPWDQSWYLETSQNLYHILTKNGIFAFLWNIQFALGGVKAPLISLLPIPLYLAFGNSEISAMIVNAVFLFLSTVYLYKTTISLYQNERIAFSSILIFHTLTLSNALNRQFLVEYGLASIIIIFIYYLLKSNYFKDKRANTALGIALGFGMLMKITFPMYIIGPTVLVLILSYKQSNQVYGKNNCYQMVKVLIIGLLISSIWYARNIWSILNFALSAGFGSAGAAYGSENVFSLKIIYNYWSLFVNEAISEYYFILALIISIAYIITLIRLKSNYINKKNAVWLFLWFIIPFIILTLGTNKDLRYIYPILPVFAISVSAMISKIVKNNLAFIITCLLLIIYPFINMVYVSFFTTNRNVMGYFIHPPDQRSWPLNEIIEYINIKNVADTSKLPYSIVAVEHGIINANTFSYLASTRDFTYPLYFTSLGYMENDISHSLRRINEIKPRFIIFQEGIPTGELSEMFNKCNNAVRKTLDSNVDIHYKIDREFKFNDGVKLILYQRY